MMGIEKLAELSDYNFFDSFIKDEEKISYIKHQIHQNGLVRNFETQLYRLPGGVLDVILTVNNLTDYKHQIMGLLFLFKDITEIKKIQQQLLQTQKLESIGMMASGIAHDFNNILAAIIPNAELIKLALDDSDINLKRAEIIEKSAHRASDIASRLLTFTRQNDHKFEEYINLNEIITDSFELLQHSLPEDIRISRELEPNLHFIKGDEAQMQQIIMNLTLNAKDAMPTGGTITISTTNFKINNYYQIGSLDPGDYIKLVFKDSGTGIPLEILPKIFDPFFTTKEVGKGTGLGLSVVYGIAKSLGGHIDVSSRVKVGTLFELYFPAKPQLV
jgi:signal transduction histidine kinase